MIFPVIVYLLVDRVVRLPGWISYATAVSAALGFVLTSQPYRIPRLLGIDAQSLTLTLTPFGVILQSLLVYGAIIIVGVGLFLLFRTNRVEGNTSTR